MFSRTVTVDGTTFHICCTPETPLSEVLRRAAEFAFREEEEKIKQNREQFRGMVSGHVRA